MPFVPPVTRARLPANSAGSNEKWIAEALDIVVPPYDEGLSHYFFWGRRASTAGRSSLQYALLALRRGRCRGAEFDRGAYAEHDEDCQDEEPRNQKGAAATESAPAGP